MFILNFIFGVFIVFLGIIIIKMNFQFTNLFSKNNIFERKLGPGSSYFVAKMFGLLVIFIGFLVSVSLYDNFILWLFSPVADALGY